MTRYISPLLPYATLLTVIVGVIFGILTVLQWHRTRHLSAAIELVRTVQTVDFARSVQLILELPVGARADLVVADNQLVIAAYVVGHAFESLGVMVYYRLLPLHLVDHLIGGYVRASWARLAPYVEARRERFGVMFGEWFQWLAERMVDRPVPAKALGAPRAYRAWRP